MPQRLTKFDNINFTYKALCDHPYIKYDTDNYNFDTLEKSKFDELCPVRYEKPMFNIMDPYFNFNITRSMTFEGIAFSGAEAAANYISDHYPPINRIPSKKCEVGEKKTVPMCPNTCKPAVCCDSDGSCVDGDDDWCCDEIFYCSNNIGDYADKKDGIRCPVTKIKDDIYSKDCKERVDLPLTWTDSVLKFTPIDNAKYNTTNIDETLIHNYYNHLFIDDVECQTSNDMDFTYH